MTNENMSVLVEAEKLCVRYDGTEALKDISFRVENSDFIGLVGPNGGGKTTLIKTILGLVPSHGGSVNLFGEIRKRFREWQKIGYLPQKSSVVNPLFPATAEEVISLGVLPRKIFPKKITKNDAAYVHAVMERLGISELRSRMISELSGGEQQKVFLARALVSNPELLILDEPSTALDPDSRESFFRLIKELNKSSGVAVILITHDLGYVGRYVNKLLYVDKRVVYFGSFSDFCKSKEMSSYFTDFGQHIICHQHD